MRPSHQYRPLRPFPISMLDSSVSLYLSPPARSTAGAIVPAPRAVQLSPSRVLELPATRKTPQPPRYGEQHS